MRVRQPSADAKSSLSPERPGEAELIALYEQNVHDVFRYCLARTANQQVAADTTSEVFLSAARYFADGAGHKVTRGWLFAVAKSRLVDHWRRTGRDSSRIEKLRQVWIRDGGGHADIADELGFVSAADVVSALASLPPRQRAALSLRYFEELSVAEIADALSVNYQAAESLLARGRRSFERAWLNQATADRSRHSRKELL